MTILGHLLNKKWWEILSEPKYFIVINKVISLFFQEKKERDDIENVISKTAKGLKEEGGKKKARGAAAASAVIHFVDWIELFFNLGPVQAESERHTCCAHYWQDEAKVLKRVEREQKEVRRGGHVQLLE